MLKSTNDRVTNKEFVWNLNSKVSVKAFGMTFSNLKMVKSVKLLGIKLVSIY